MLVGRGRGRGDCLLGCNYCQKERFILKNGFRTVHSVTKNKLKM